MRDHKRVPVKCAQCGKRVGFAEHIYVPAILCSDCYLKEREG